MENGPFEDVFPIKNGDIPASYVSLPEGKHKIHVSETGTRNKQISNSEISASFVTFLAARLTPSSKTYICAMVKSRYIGDGHPTFNRNPYNGYINPYYWVDDHPLLMWK